MPKKTKPFVVIVVEGESADPSELCGMHIKLQTEVAARLGIADRTLDVDRTIINGPGMQLAIHESMEV